MSVGQTDVQRFEPHLGHNWLSCGVSCKVVLWSPSSTNHNGQIGNLSQRVARSLYKRGVFTKSTWRDEGIYCSKSERVITRLYLYLAARVTLIFLLQAYQNKMSWWGVRTKNSRMADFINKLSYNINLLSYLYLWTVTIQAIICRLVFHRFQLFSSNSYVLVWAGHVAFDFILK